MIGRPSPNEAAPYYFGYINRVSGEDILHALHTQLDETISFLRGIPEESLSIAMRRRSGASARCGVT